MRVKLLGRCNICLLILSRELTRDRSIETTKVQLDDPMSFVGVICRSVGEGLCTEAEMTQTAASPKPASPKPTPDWMTTHKS